MNKKGFTVVELMTTFTLIAIISILLINLTLTLKEIYINGDMKTALLTKQGNMTDKIYKDLKENKLFSLTSCGTNCINFEYENGTKVLKINKDKKILTYDNYSIKLGDGGYFGTVEISNYDSDIGYILNLNVPIYHKLVKGDFGINITHQLENLNYDEFMYFDVLKNDRKYKEKILNGADPVLSGSLIPVTISNDGTVTKANLTSNWYSYENKRWANAIILNDETKKFDTGDVIPESDIESYFVWIPRYKYKLFDLGTYNSYSGTSKPTRSNAKEIDIVFGTDTTNDSNTGECTTPGVSGETGNCKKGDYMTHPAFLAFDTNGLWVGKFETTGTIDNITVKPGKISLRSQKVKSIFETVYNYKKSNKSHMMKNTEWGAVAYLSHSKYGINKEININNNSGYLTGYSAVEGTDQSDYLGESGQDENITLAYNTSTGYKASTTGNITGIYDMSGGTHEYMASYMDGKFGSSGFESDPTTTYGEEYFDKYSSTSTVTGYNNRILGDATGEIGPFYQYKDGDGGTRNHNSWYFDNSRFISSDKQWFERGGSHDSGILAGSVAFISDTGKLNVNIGFRLVLTK